MKSLLLFHWPHSPSVIGLGSVRRPFFLLLTVLEAA